MTRKHFEALAETIRFMSLDSDVRQDRETLRLAIAKELAETLARFNGAFDAERFLSACQPKGTEGHPAWLAR